MLSPGECLSNRDDAVGISMRDITDSNSSDQGSLQHRKRPLVQSTIITANDELIEEDIVNEQSQYQLATSSFIDKSISDYDNALVIKNGTTDFCLDRGRIMIKEERIDFCDAQILEGVDVRPERVIGLVDAVVEEDRNDYEQLESEEGINKNDNIDDMNDNSKRDGADEGADNNDVGDNGRRNNDYEHDGVGTGENSNANFDIIDDNDGNHFNGSNSDSAGDCSGDNSGIINNGQSYEGILNGHLICDSNRCVRDEGDEQISGKGRLGDEMRSCCEGGAEERNTETSLVGMDLEEASVELMERVLESLGDEIDIDDLVSDGEGDDDTTDYEDSNELRAVQLPETSELQQKQDIVKDRLGSSPLPMSNPMDSGNVSSETMSQDLPVGNQRVSGESAYAEKCSGTFEEDVILIDLSDSSHQSVSDTSTSSNETIAVISDNMNTSNDITNNDENIHNDNEGNSNDKNDKVNDTDTDGKDIRDNNCNSNDNGDSGSSKISDDSNSNMQNEEMESMDRQCEKHEIGQERYHSEAIDNIVERSLTDEFSSKQSQLNPRKSRTTTPSGTSLSGQEEDDEGEGELMAKMFTRSMGIAAVGDDEKGYSAAFRLPTNLEIRQGDEYQCRVEGLEEWEAANRWSEDGRSVRECTSPDRDVCLWRMPDEQVIDVAEVDAYLCLAYELHEADGDEALYILQSCGYNTSTALEYLKKRTSLKDIWSSEDVALFLGAFRQHGKKFREIRRWLPHKSIAEVMNFYYDNKKRLKLSDILMERVHDEPPESSDESDSDESMEESDEETKDGRCERCGFEQTGLQKSNHHDRFLCDSCAARFSVAVAVTRQKRCRGVLKRVKPMKNFVPGADMIDAFSTLMKNKASASPSNGQSTSYEQPQYQNAFEFEKSGYRDVFREQRRRRELEKNIIEARALCSRLMLEDQRESKLYLANDVDKYRTMIRAHYNSPSRGASRPAQYDPKWSMKESVYAVTAFKCYGKEFKQIAALIGTKTPIMVKRFYDKFHDHIDKVIQQGQEIRDDKAEWKKDRKLNGCSKAKRLKF